MFLFFFLFERLCRVGLIVNEEIVNEKFTFRLFIQDDSRERSFFIISFGEIDIDVLIFLTNISCERNNFGVILTRTREIPRHSIAVQFGGINIFNDTRAFYPFVKKIYECVL